MNVYDFDNTIYDGESTFDFFVFCLKKDLRCIKYVFPVVKTLVLYKLCKITIEDLERKSEKYMADFMLHINNPMKLIKEFWDKNEHKIKDFYIKQKQADDVIISASCEEFLQEICNRLNIKNLIASKIDFKTGKVKYICYSENKVSLFKQFYPDSQIDEFYSDSKNDLPMMKLAKKAYFVKNNKITEFKK